MTSKVFANSRTITHQGDGLTQVAAPPDVCNTPSPGGPPVPVPYVNSAQDAQLVNGSKRTTIGGHPIALESSSIAISSGDEPGTAGGIISAKFKGKLTWATSSPDVRVEGKGVVRFMDVTQHNGNSFNTTFMQSGGTGFAYADDFSGLCPICNRGPDSHAVPEMIEGSAALAEAIRKDLNALEAKAKAKRAGLSKAERQKLPPEDHRLSDKRGYMVGVMICKCKQKFAAISGAKPPPRGFTNVAKAHGCQVVSEPAQEDDFLKSNPRPGSSQTLTNAWDAARNESVKGSKGYSPPGLCAAAKLTMKSGHIPVSMTEFYFFWTDEKAPWQSYRMSFRGPASMAPSSSAGPWRPPAQIPKGDGFADTEIEDVKLAFGDTVTSCNTCRETLRFTMCDKDERTCASSQAPTAESSAPPSHKDVSKPDGAAASSARPAAQPAAQPLSKQSSEGGFTAPPDPTPPRAPAVPSEPPTAPSEAPSWSGGGGQFGGGGASGSWAPNELKSPKGKT